MSKGYKIVTLYGRTEDLFRMIGSFAMNRKVIREFEGYPLIADERMVWFIAMKNNAVVSFSSIKQYSTEIVEFTNSYTVPEYRKKGLHGMLFKERIKWCKDSRVKVITATCREGSLPIFKRNGFSVTKELKTWTKVQKRL